MRATSWGFKSPLAHHSLGRLVGSILCGRVGGRSGTGGPDPAPGSAVPASSSASCSDRHCRRGPHGLRGVAHRLERALITHPADGDLISAELTQASTTSRPEASWHPDRSSRPPHIHPCLFTEHQERSCWRLGSTTSGRSSGDGSGQPIQRSPADVLRLVVAAVVVLLLLVVEWLFGDTLVAFASDLLRGLDAVPQWIIDVIVIGTRILGVIVLGGGLVWILYRRRWRMLVTVAIAGVLAVVIFGWLDALVETDQGLDLGRGGRGSGAADDRGIRVDGGHRRGRRDAHRRRPVARPPVAPGRMGPDRRSRGHGVRPGAGVVRRRSWRGSSDGSAGPRSSSSAGHRHVDRPCKR